MGILRDEARKLSGTLRQRTAEPELDEEIQFHLDMQTAKNVRLGMSEEEARRAALVSFGGLDRFKEEARDEYRSRPLEDLVQDLRYGVRSALGAPLFTLLAVLTLALGIGANAAVFGVVKSVLLDALPYARADRLVRISMGTQDGTMQRSGVSAGAFVDIAERQRSFTRVTPFFNGVDNLVYSGEGGPQVLTFTQVGPGFFQTLGVKAPLGRTLTDADAGAEDLVVLLSHGAWQRLFAGDPRALGRTLRLNGRPRKLVGVLPRGFVGPMGDADVWLPLDLRPTLSDPVHARRRHWLGLVGRLAPGATLERARRELDVIAADLAREHPDADAGHVFTPEPLRDSMVGETRTPLLLLLASAGLVLLITCANLAAALLSRTLSRRQEFAVRVALGAGRGRLVRQLLTESCLLAAAGGAAGLLLAELGLATVRGFALPLPAYASLSLDPVAVAVMSLIAVVTGLAFGLVPALAAGRANPQGALREGTRGASESRRTRRLRGVLVAAQIALCVSLLAGAGLLARSLWAMSTAPLGFNPDGVLAVTLQFPSHEYDKKAVLLRFYERFTERLRALPGVTGVAGVSELPSPVMNRNGLAIQGVTWPEKDSPPFITYVSVSDDYFRAMGIPLLQGRTFGPADRPDTTTAIVVSQSMAKRYWPDGGAIGARIRMGPDVDAPWFEVVGIVGDVRNDPARPEPEPEAYGSSRQDIWMGTFLIRTQGDPRSLLRSVRRELAAIDPEMAMSRSMPLRDYVAEKLAGRRLPVLLMTGFGALALLLASVGVYAMFASMVAAREREFGLRVVLGSTRQAIAALVLWAGAAWMAAGLAGGAIGIVVVTRLLRNLLFGVPPFDPVALGVSVAALLACATVALLVPLRRATRIDPINVIRV